MKLPLIYAKNFNVVKRNELFRKVYTQTVVTCLKSVIETQE